MYVQKVSISRFFNNGSKKGSIRVPAPWLLAPKCTARGGQVVEVCALAGNALINHLTPQEWYRPVTLPYRSPGMRKTAKLKTKSSGREQN